MSTNSTTPSTGDGSGAGSTSSGGKLISTTVLALLAAIVLALYLRPRAPEGSEAVPEAAASGEAGASAAGVAPPGAAGVGAPAALGGGQSPRGSGPRIVRLDPSAKAAISGRVLDPDGKPLGGAAVRARLDTTGLAAPDGESATDAASPVAGTRTAAAGVRRRGQRGPRAPEATTRTASDGTYRLAGLGDGLHALEARAEGYRIEEIAGIAAKAGEEVQGVDFLLQRGERILGVVLDPDGRPLEGASVVARTVDARRGVRAAWRGDTDAGAKTGADGSFEMFGLTVGRKALVASAQGFRRTEPTEVEVRAGEAARVELRLEKGVFIAGRVTLASGTPAPGVRVEVRAEMGGGGPPGMAPGGAMRPGETVTATTGEDGRYRAEGLAGQRFRAIATADDPSLAPGVRGGIRAGEENADLVLLPGATILGVVVRKGTKEPVPGASVSVGDNQTRKSAAADDAGRFELGPIPPAEYDVRAEAEGRASLEVKVKVGPGERKDGVVIELPEGSVIEGRVFAIAGGRPLAGAVVRAIEQGRGGAQGGRGGGGRRGGPGGPGAMEEMMVEALAGSADLSEFVSQTELDQALKRNATTDERGRFRIADLPGGTFRVYAAHSEYPGNGTSVTLDGDGDKKEIEIGLPDGGGIAGRVVDLEGRGRPDENVMAFSFLGKGRVARTNDRGEYVMKGVAPGSYFVMLGASVRSNRGRLDMNRATAGVGFESKNANVEMGKTTQVDFGNEPRCILAGTITREGAPVKGQFIQFFPDGGLAGLRGTTSSDEGRYEVDLLPGRYVVRIDNASENLEIPKNVPALAKDFRMPVGSLAGRAVNAASGEPLKGGRVSVYKAERAQEVDTLAGALGTIAGEGRVQDDGTFTVKGLAPGLYTITAQADGFARARLDGVEVPPDAERSGVELACEPGGVIRGQVVNELREPVAGAAIVIVDASATDLPGGDPPRTNEEGIFEIKRFSPGRYRVTIITETYAPHREYVNFTGGTVELNRVLVTGGTLEITVTSEAGQPLPGALVELRYPEGDRVVTGFVDFIQPAVPTGGDGRVRKARLPAGPLAVKARFETPQGGLPPLAGEAPAVVIEKGEVRINVGVR